MADKLTIAPGKDRRFPKGLKAVPYHAGLGEQREAGGSFRTSARPMLNRRTQSTRPVALRRTRSDLGSSACCQ